ncbi:voltage-dependent potassium channel, beta subunit [Conidiobolus coronatus NRRL 28638]|uniref:Voltage-dependent potassium channel, beta subunit n=1 Tax=Conidiobolus coronatus (strain ATCC 28846 / CBS 209.66 / NRRL 28638) TaxID=796925 RepID=A0A137P9T0_CONC2|nr:voltage-dependent potassium channel, beta subunit [Conidiobolus coronatus NRRL 28638]|eukprot:KXN71714.1 voltage-dependent potassium channel, beta subunit [Conidiobolus coronatus NRRL 28638]
MTQMIYRRLGRSGLKVSVLSFGGWLTVGNTVDQALTDKLMKAAFDNGINFFDNAEVYAQGQSETVMGQSIINNNFKREDIVVATKIFFGTGGWGPNANGLSKKHLIEGLNASLKRLQLEYVDLVFAHRPDTETPMEEIVRGFNHLINQGKAFYWGTSEWTAQQLTEAHVIAQRLGLEGPVMEQPQYNLFERENVEKEYLPLYENFGLGTTIWSPLYSGVLTGKYNNGIQSGTRLGNNDFWGKTLSGRITTAEGQAKIEKVKEFVKVADKTGCTAAQLAIAWCVKNPNVSTVITGASKVEQLESNIKSLEFLDKLTPEILNEIDDIFKTKPTPLQNFRG